MRWVVGGASGFIGTALVRSLRAAGDDVVCLVRREPRSVGEFAWDDPQALDGADVVVTLGGVGIGDRRWTAARRRLILSSRLWSTSTMADLLARHSSPPPVWLSASAIGYYGDTGEAIADESSPRGDGFLASVVEQWEAACAPAVDAGGVRVVCCRSGIVLSPSGSTLGRLLPIFRAGLSGRIGSGRQWMSWIALADEIAALRFLAAQSSIHGAVNLTAPSPVRNAEFTRALARAVHRPAVVPVPAFALRAAFGGFADEGVLASARVVPARLEDAGFSFGFEDVDSALRAMLG